MGAEASNATFFTSVFFVAALACFAISFIMWWFPYHLFSDEVYNIVVVNSPDSFKQFNKDMQQEFDEMAEDYGDRYDYFANWENMADFEYIYVGYGWTEFIYKDTDALYDFVTFGKWMRENDAYLTVVFPKDFDEQIRLRQEGKTDAKPQILTYYRTNSMEYSQMREGFIEEYLDYYQSTIRENYGLVITSVEERERNLYRDSLNSASQICDHHRLLRRRCIKDTYTRIHHSHPISSARTAVLYWCIYIDIYLHLRSCGIHRICNDPDLCYQRYRCICPDCIPPCLPDPGCRLRHMYPVGS